MIVQCGERWHMREDRDSIYRDFWSITGSVSMAKLGMRRMVDIRNEVA